MKNITWLIFMAFLALLPLSVIAQTSPQPPKKGTYYTKKFGAGLSLNILDGDRYELVVFSGNFKQSNDTLHFNYDVDKSPFDITFVKDKVNTTRKISFTGSSINYATGHIYLGVPQLNDSIKYQSLSQLLNVSDYDALEDSLYSLDIDITSHIFLVDEADTAATVLKYNIPLNVSELKVVYNPISLSKVSLTGIINPDNGQIEITDGKQPMNFILKDDADMSSNLVKAAESKVVAQWSYEGKAEVMPDASEEYYDESDSAYAESYVESEPAYTFVVPVFESLTKALENAKSLPNNILVVMFDPKASQPTEEYNSFITTYQQETQYKMYESYLPQHDRYNFYFAPSSDAKSIAKMGVKVDQPTILFLNNQGTLLYYSNEVTLNDHFYYYNPESLYGELQIVNGSAQLDAALKNTTSTADDFTNALILVASGNNDYDSYLDEDTTSTVFYTLSVAENRYSFRGSKEQVINKWSQLLSAQVKSNKFDRNCAIIAHDEVANQGFSKSLFHDRGPLLSATDYLAITYIGQHQAEILTIEDSDGQGYPKYTSYMLSMTVVDALNRQLDAENEPSPVQIHQALNSYKEYVTATKGNSIVMNSYLDVLLKANMGSLFIDTYSAYFKDVVSDSRDIRVHLDVQYNQEPIGTDWRDFKYGFANRANNAAWYVVEHSKDLDIIKRAIVWSETSLELEKNNVYYLDTLAQLYYLNGEYDKAMTTEQLAIDLCGETVSDENKEVMKSVLAKMKNRTY